MNSQQIFNSDPLLNHPVEIFFHVSVTQCAAGKALLVFKVRAESFSANFESAGALGLVVDYAARAAGHSRIGRCCVTEHEINFRAQSKTAVLTVSVSVGTVGDYDATFCCKIFSGVNRKRFIAESHGTLSAASAGLTVPKSSTNTIRSFY